MAGIPIWQVDAFTDRPFSGNPAAVCLLDEAHIHLDAVGGRGNETLRDGVCAKTRR